MTRPDLRMPVLGLAAWAGGLVAAALPLAWPPLVALRRSGRWRGGRRRRALLARRAGASAAVAGSAAAAAGPGRPPTRSPGWPRCGAAVERRAGGDLRPAADAERVRRRRRAPGARSREVTGRGATHELRAPVLVLAGESWPDVPLGAGCGSPAARRPEPDDDTAGGRASSASGDPEVVARPDVWWRAAGAVRASLRDVGRPPPDEPAGAGAGAGRRRRRGARRRARRGLPDHRAHPPARGLGHQPDPGRRASCWCSAGGAGSAAAGTTSSARSASSGSCCSPAPSRAWCAPPRWGRSRCSGWASTAAAAGPRALGVAVVALLLLDPGLAVSVGFALSVRRDRRASCCSRPGLRDALRRWLPRWVAEAVAVPLAAQLACTPLVAAISGQVSLVAVGANLAVAPAVGPATVLGLAGGLVGLVCGPGRAGCSARSPAGASPGSSTVAERGAALPAAGGRAGGPASWPLVAADRCSWSRSRWRCRGCCGGPVGGLGLLLPCSSVAVLVRPPTPGWPPAGLGAGRLRRRPGRRAGAARRAGRGGRRRRRTRPAAGRPAASTGSASSGCRCWC